MKTDDDKVPGMMQSANAFIAFVVFFSQLWTKPLQALTTRPGTAGRRWFGSLTFGLGLMCFPFLMPILAQVMELRPERAGFGGATLFWLLMIFAGMVQRARGALLRKRGYSVASAYWGNPILSPWLTLTFRDPVTHKVKNDFLLMMAWGCGFGVLVDSPLVIGYGVIGALLSLIPVMWYQAQDTARIEAAEDAQHDAEWLANELKKRRANRWN